MDETLPVSEARNRLSDLVNDVSTTHNRYTITRNGAPAAVLLSADEWAEVTETIFWTGRPGVQDDIREARAERDGGTTVSLDEARRALAARER